jgi:hypothetical protein
MSYYDDGAKSKVNLQAWRDRMMQPLEKGHPYYPPDVPDWKIASCVAVLITALVGVCFVLDAIITRACK